MTSVTGAGSVTKLQSNQAGPKPRQQVQKLLDEGWRPDLSADASLDRFLAAFKLAKTIGDTCGLAASMYGEGMCWQYKGDQTRASYFYGAASKVQLQIGDLAGAAESLKYLGISQTKIGNPSDGLEALFHARELYHRLIQPSGESTCLNTIAAYRHNQGRDQDALKLFRQAESLATLAKDKTTLIESLSQVAQVYISLNQRNMAEATAKRALAMCDKDTPQPDVSFAFEAVGVATRAADRTFESLTYLNRARDIEFQTGNVAREVELLGEIGSAETKLGLHAAAIQHITRANLLCVGMHDPSVAAGILHQLADEYMAISLPGKAQVYFLRAAKAWRQCGDGRAEALALARVAEIDLSQGHRRTAIWRLKMAVNIYQIVRKGLTGLDKKTRNGYRDKIAFVYRELADALIAEGRLPEAEAVIDLLKDEEYFSLLRKAGKATEVDLTHVERDWSDKYNTVMSRAVKAEQDFSVEDAKGEKADQNKLAGLRAKLHDSNEAVTAFLKSAQTAFESLGVDTDRLADVRNSKELVNILHDPEVKKHHPAAIYTLMTKDGVSLILTLPSTRVAYPQKAKIDSSILLSLISEFREAVKDRSKDPRGPGSRLYDILVRPIESDLQKTGSQTLLWSLDGPLRYVPIWALYDSRTEKYLIEKYSSAVFIPSMADRMRQEPTTKWSGSTFACTKAARIGDETFPRLRNAEAEAQSVSRLLHSHTFEDENFNAGTLMNAMAHDKGVLHIVSHFYLQPADIEKSYLLLGDGNSLSLSIFNREFPQTDANLLVLSACDTGVGGNSDGSEFEGFARMAQDKGAGAVIATLWPVEDKSTSILMSNFYRIHIANPKMTKMEALHRAQLAMLYGTRGDSGDIAARGSVPSNGTTRSFKFDPKRPHSHPFYWAGFVLFGNWR